MEISGTNKVEVSVEKLRWVIGTARKSIKTQTIKVGFESGNMKFSCPSCNLGLPADGVWEQPEFYILAKHFRNIDPSFTPGEVVTIKLEDGQICVGTWRTDMMRTQRG